MTSSKGKIYLVPTPIGNMGDITRRAVETLESVDLIACEDTRHSGRFLKQLGISKKLISYHDFNEAARARQLVERISEGQSVAVITDGGSPGISDPAYRIVRAAIENGIDIVPLPGASALVPALTASGLPTDRFFFEGFLPPKSSARKTRLAKLKQLKHTLVFYESPHRIGKTLDDICEVLGVRQMCLAREISKKFEEFLRGSTVEIRDRISGRSIKGEIVIIVAGDIE
ncbi:MAG: 16S rRNA (cytidine(1402)-2'-O)-methyltransferase [Candidatus Zixiibacteriota bacterium]